MPGVLANVYSNWYNKNSYIAGELFYVRELVENNNMDFGDIWSAAVAHMRTWDIPNRGADYAAAEEEDFNNYKSNPDVQPPIPAKFTIENRKTAAEIDPILGTEGKFVAGPATLRPGPHAWNCLTLRNVEAGRVVSISLRWGDGMGFQPDTKPSWIIEQQAGCDNDPRFYNSIAVAHNTESGERRYFKAKGKSPDTVHIETNGPTNIHIILMPSPPTDYIGGIYRREDNGYDDLFNPIPVYNYEYQVDIQSAVLSGVSLTAAEEKENGIVKFNPATPGWWPVQCVSVTDLNHMKRLAFRCL